MVAASTNHVPKPDELLAARSRGEGGGNARTYWSADEFY